MKSLITTVLCICASTLFAFTGEPNKGQNENEPSTNQLQGNTAAPDEVDPNSVKYRRSSLFTIMIGNEGLPYADTIEGTFMANPIPEKFNDHNAGPRIIPYNYDYTQTVRGYDGRTETVKEKQGGSKLKSLVGLSTSSDETTIGKEESLAIIEHFLANHEVAKQMVAKWFNRDENGLFNMDLISQRGYYDASVLDASVVKNTTRGLSTLADAGEELIKNTFVLVSNFKYTDKEEVAAKVNSVLKFAASLVPEDASEETKESMESLQDGVTTLGKGYIVKTTSYLYRLVWNDSVAAVFYNDYWTDENYIDTARIKAFDETNLFQLELIGSEVAWAGVQSTTYSDRTDEQLVYKATINALDAVIAKLQRKYDEFRTKTPLYSIDPITAKIGLKEGLEGGDKFDVLEQVVNKDGRTEYKKISQITVDKKQIWDNRFSIDAVDVNAETSATLFKGNSKNLYPGLLIKQSK